MPAVQTAPETSTFSLTQTRIIRAPRQKVYEAWTNPEIMKQWFGNAAMQCAQATLDARVGGDYCIEMALRPGIDPATYGGRTCSGTQGRYTQVIPGQLLQFTWNPTWNPDEHSTVTVTLKDVPEGTELTVVHEQLASEASRDAHNAGWTSGLDRLQSILAIG